jgi:hypothetical protein
MALFLDCTVFSMLLNVRAVGAISAAFFVSITLLGATQAAVLASFIQAETK